jgi:hypothetical protein
MKRPMLLGNYRNQATEKNSPLSKSLQSFSKVVDSVSPRQDHQKPSIFDPNLTYNPPQRGVVMTTAQKPRERLKELYKHYEKKGNF